MNASHTLHTVGTGLVVVALGATVWLGANRSRARADEGRARDAIADQGVHVLTTKVKPTPAGRVVRLQGDVRAIRQATLYAKVSGYLQTLKVDRGDVVKEGQVLATIQSPETAQQEISAQADLLLRERTEKRVRALLPSGVVSQQEMDNASGGLDVSKAEAARIHAVRGYEGAAGAVQRAGDGALRRSGSAALGGDGGDRERATGARRGRSLPRPHLHLPRAARRGAHPRGGTR